MSYGPPNPGYQQPYQPRPQAEGATTALVLGLLGLLLCQILSPFAWMQGNKALQRIAESNGGLEGEGMAKAGQILGIIGTILLGLGILAALIAIVVSIITYASS
jgi:divalent metal cation (Fe/Co/Zn/Cd) transporter